MLLVHISKIKKYLDNVTHFPTVFTIISFSFLNEKKKTYYLKTKTITVKVLNVICHIT